MASLAHRADASVTTSGSGSHWDEALRITSALPLVECQLHLESSVPPEWLATRAASRSLALQPCAPARLGPQLRAQRGFPGAVTWVLQCLQTHDDLRDAVAAVVYRAAGEGVSWLELHVCPHHHTGGGLSLREVVACVCAGFKAAAAGTNCDGGVVLVVNAPEQSVADAHTTVTLAAQHARQGVLGVQLSAGGHPGTDLAPWHSVGSSVVAAELPLSVHVSDGPCAGSSGGPDGTQELQIALRNVSLALEVGACRLSGAQCLRHAGSAQQAAAVAAGTPLIVCLTHSCRAREPGWPRFPAQHPIGGMLAAGLVCVPAVGHALLTEQPWHEGASPGASELAHLVANCGLSWQHIRTLLMDAAAATLMLPQAKAAWLPRYQGRLDAALARVAAPGMGVRTTPGIAPRSMHGVQVSPEASPDWGVAHAVARVFVNTDAVSRPQDDPALLLRRSALMPRGGRFKAGDGTGSPKACSPGEGGSPQGRAPSPPPGEAGREVSTVPPRWALSLPAPRSGEDAWQGGRYHAGEAAALVQNAMTWLKMDEASPVAKPPVHTAQRAPLPPEHRTPPPPAPASVAGVQEKRQSQPAQPVDVETAAVAAARRIADKRGAATLQRPLPPVALRAQQAPRMSSPSSPKEASPPAHAAPSPPPLQQWQTAVASAPASPSDPSYTLPIRGKLSEKRRLQQVAAAASTPMAVPPSHLEMLANTLGIPLAEALAAAAAAGLHVPAQAPAARAPAPPVSAPPAAPQPSYTRATPSPPTVQAPPVVVLPVSRPAAAAPPAPVAVAPPRGPPVAHAVALSRTAEWASSTAAVLIAGFPPLPGSTAVANGHGSPSPAAVQTADKGAAVVPRAMEGKGWADDPSGVSFTPIQRAPFAPAGPSAPLDGTDEFGRAWKLLSAPSSMGERARVVDPHAEAGLVARAEEDGSYADGGF